MHDFNKGDISTNIKPFSQKKLSEVHDRVCDKIWLKEAPASTLERRLGESRLTSAMRNSDQSQVSRLMHKSSAR